MEPEDVAACGLVSDGGKAAEGDPWCCRLCEADVLDVLGEC